MAEHTADSSTRAAPSVASPAATGGAGNTFEQHVGAYWLALLLVRGIPPVLTDCTVERLHFQTKYLGWATDDLLVVGRTTSGAERRLAVQVKRRFTVSEKDGDFCKTVRDAWSDFGNSGVFNPEDDRLAVVTQRGPDTILAHLAGLMDCARASRDANDFERRIEEPGFLHKKAKKYLGVIRRIVSADREDVELARLWAFLQRWFVLSNDLATPTAQLQSSVTSMLAFAEENGGDASAAGATWDSLVVKAGTMMPHAGQVERGQLPPDLLNRHKQPVERRFLQEVAARSELVLSSIRTQIGAGVHIARVLVVGETLAALRRSPFVLVSGAAGVGKSAVAKMVFLELAQDHFAFAVRAEEFAEPHLDRALQAMNWGSSLSLESALAAQGRKVLLIDSVERLLEHSTRDAFTDLLRFVAKDSSWRVLATCRDYSLELVRRAFFASCQIDHEVVAVPSLNDDELRLVEEALPRLQQPLQQPGLRGLLSNPYVLDRALQIDWKDESNLPGSERELRKLFFREIVRAGHRFPAEVASRRAETFEAIALTRARMLVPYVSTEGLDIQALDSLVRDSLVTASDEEMLKSSPAHDALEDWAILSWLDRMWKTGASELSALERLVGPHPAVRRVYRRWVTELLEAQPVATDGLVEQAIVAGEGSSFFRDDTIVALLSSSRSASLLKRNAEELAANGGVGLARVVHLLRVACVKLSQSIGGVSYSVVPDGSAWAAVLKLVEEQATTPLIKDIDLYVGLVEDWAQGVSAEVPYPEGHTSVSSIAHSLLPLLSDYDAEEQRKRVLGVLARIPRSDSERFVALATHHRERGDRNRAADELREMLVETLQGVPCARDLPDCWVRVAKDHLLRDEEALSESHPYSSAGLYEEETFGLRAGTGSYFFPSSAYQGAFLGLLNHSALEGGLEFAYEVINHSVLWYSKQERPNAYEPAHEVSIQLPDGEQVVQWTNERLWCLYRGTTVGPNALQSLLMALERWLLAVAKGTPQADKVGLELIKRSRSASLTAVVASAAVAYPLRMGRTLLTLLAQPAFIHLDRQRMAKEISPPSRVFDHMPFLDAGNKVFEDERRQSDALAHRTQDLEMAILRLQTGELANEVQALLDEHLSSLPREGERSQPELMWQLALHRMDLRNYRPGERLDEHRVSLDMAAPPEQVQEMIEAQAPEFQRSERLAAATMWGVAVVEGRDTEHYPPNLWREKLKEARESNADDDGPPETSQCPANYVTAICIRDHWTDLSEKERVWLLGRVQSELARDQHQWEGWMRDQIGVLSGRKEMAHVLPSVFGHELDDELQTTAIEALFIGLLHPSAEIRGHLVAGIGDQLWSRDQELAVRCVEALRLEATHQQRCDKVEEAKPYAEQRASAEIEKEAAGVAHAFLVAGGAAANTADFDPSCLIGVRAYARMLRVLAGAPRETLSREAFARLPRTLVAWWDEDADRRSEHQQPRGRSVEVEQILRNTLCDFLMRTEEDAAVVTATVIAGATENHPREVESVLTQLLFAEDRLHQPERFWKLWQVFADALLKAEWLAKLDRRYASGSELVSAVFLGHWWKEDADHWPSLDGHAERLHALFEQLPASARILEKYVYFLYKIGTRSLPEGFRHIDTKLCGADDGQLLSIPNTVFLLEVILQRHVYGRPGELKSNEQLRAAVLRILDSLVSKGSSIAFRMRDDFVTPSTA